MSPRQNANVLDADIRVRIPNTNRQSFTMQNRTQLRFLEPQSYSLAIGYSSPGIHFPPGCAEQTFTVEVYNHHMFAAWGGKCPRTANQKSLSATDHDASPSATISISHQRSQIVRLRRHPPFSGRKKTLRRAASPRPPGPRYWVISSTPSSLSVSLSVSLSDSLSVSVSVSLTCSLSLALSSSGPGSSPSLMKR